MCFSENPTYVCLLFNEQMTNFAGFVNGANRYALYLRSTAWVLYSPTSDLVSSGGVLLGPSTNNMEEYQSVIGLLTEALASDVREIRVYLDFELVFNNLIGSISSKIPYFFVHSKELGC